MSLNEKLVAPATMSQCHAKVFCGEEGDIHTNHRWPLDKAERDQALGILRAARSLVDSINLEIAVNQTKIGPMVSDYRNHLDQMLKEAGESDL